VRLHEKGGKEHEAPCVPKLEAYLIEALKIPRQSSEARFASGPPAIFLE
jgi:hypothetical protein